jgi:hypothetical protein
MYLFHKVWRGGGPMGSLILSGLIGLSPSFYPLNPMYLIVFHKSTIVVLF